MSKPKNYRISVEVFKYPYCGRLYDTEDYLSNQICCGAIKIRKKFLKTVKLLIFYGDPIVRLPYSLFPSQAIGVPIPPPRMRSIQLNGPLSNSPLSKKAIIAQVSKEMSSEIVFTKTEMDQLYDLSVKYKNNTMSKEKLLTEISNLRGGSGVEIAAFLVIVATITLLIESSSGFQPNPNANIPPHLQWIYGNQQPGNQFGYGKSSGPRSITVLEATQNAGSDKKDPSSGSYNYIDVMKKLEKQSSNNSIEIQVGDQIYMLKNPDRKNADELQFKLAEEIYDSIRECDTDICDIAENLGFKADNIKNVKDHVFNNEHDLDRYGPDEIEHKRFDATLEQALAWKRLEAGIHTQDDITWIKHECAERHHELKYDSGYSEAHERAQSRYDGYPWENKF
jgi:hypothetical protein